MATIPGSQARDVEDMVLSRSIDYHQAAFSHPNYKFNNVYPNNYGAPIALNASQIPVQIVLPTVVYNLSQSYLTFQINLTTPTANNYIWTFEDTWSAISHIQLYGQSGQYMVDLDNVQNYMKLVTKKETSLHEYLTNNPDQRLYPANGLINAVPSLRVGPLAQSPFSSSMNYSEPAYVAVGAISTAVVINCVLPLRMLKDTLFSVDKDIYMGQPSYLRIYFGPISKICYMSTVNNDPNGGIPVAYATVGTPQILNLQLYLAVENNQQIVESVIAKVNQPGGLKMFIPWVQSFKNSNLGASQNIVIPFDIGNGQTLSKVTHSIFNNTESLNTAYDCANIYNPALGNAANAQTNMKVLQYRTALQGKPLQDIILDSTGTNVPGVYTDYLQNRNQFVGSILQNQNIYSYNWFHCDDFANLGPNYEQSGQSNLLSGVAMANTPLVWTFNGIVLTSANYFHYTYAQFIREMTLSPTLTTIQ